MAGIGCYPNDRPKLGLVEIINNLDTDQPATQNDVREFTHACRWIGMQVETPYLDLEEDVMNSKLDQILAPSRDLKEFDMFILALICHGNIGDELKSADKAVCTTVSKIVEKFDALEDMRGRPKILILEACRGNNDNKGFTFNAVKGDSQSMVRLPNRSDVFIAYATVPGFFAYTEPKGSPFILTLASKMIELAETNHHLGDIITGVIGELRDKDLSGCKQQAAQESTLGRLLYLKKREKTYFLEARNVAGTKMRMFGDRNGWGQISFDNRQFYFCNFQNGVQSWTGRLIIEFPTGDVQEIDVHPGATWENWTGDGVCYNIRDKWRFEGQLRWFKKVGSVEGLEEGVNLRHGTGVFYFSDGSYYIGGFEFGKISGYGCKFSKDDKILEKGIWKDDKLVKKI